MLFMVIRWGAVLPVRVVWIGLLHVVLKLHQGVLLEALDLDAALQARVV